MHSWNLREPFQIPCEVDLYAGDGTLPINNLPRQLINGDLIVSGTNEKRCSILIDSGPTLNRGSYGLIRKARRSTSSSDAATIVCVKSPQAADFSLCPEAIIQAFVVRELERAGILGAVPRVYDIFQYAGETRFSMEFVDGRSAIDAVTASKTPDLTWKIILAQTALLLGWLEEHLRIDHRDLKADNLWIRDRPCSYVLTVGGVKWHLQAPFQVVILDFGFACLGGEDGRATLSLSDGVLPTLDPCPKDGRDLFHLVSSMWSIPLIRYRMSVQTQKEMDELLSYQGAPYAEVVKRSMRTAWVYLTTSEPSFSYPPLAPRVLLSKLRGSWPGGGYLQE